MRSATARTVTTGLLVLAVLASARALRAQVFDEGRTRAPRFLFASAGSEEPVRIDPSRLSILRSRITVRLERVTLGEALDAIVAQSGMRLVYSRALVPLDRRVSLKAEDITVAAALTEVLLDAGMDVLVSPSGQAALVPRKLDAVPAVPEPVAGSVTGRVTDASSGAPIAGANVVLEGTSMGVVTEQTGRYRIESVPAGTYIVVAHLIGYTDARRAVVINDGQETTANIELSVSPFPMDELIVTGTAFETKRKSLPSPINVIDARDIERKQATTLQDLIRGEIPGVVAVNFGQDDYTTRVYVRGNAAWSTLDLIKIYIDGVEVARPVYLSTIDPNNIERIEVVRGPQASTIYGSEAASGVMQIFTRKGRSGMSRPQLELKSSIGAIESDYTPSDVSTPLISNLALALSGGSDGFSYHVSTNYLSTGEWLRNYGSDNLGFMASLRTVQGPLTAEFSAQVSERTFQQALYPIFLRYPASPSCPNCGNPEAVNKRDYTFNQNTVGLNLTFQASPRWRHSLILGHDDNRADYHQPEPNLYSPADTFVSLFQSDQRRRSVRYNTAYDVSFSPTVTGRFTAGADYWTFNAVGSQGNYLLQASSPVKPSPWYTASFTNDDWWNAGYFGMAEVGFHDRLFLTLATRIEHNPNFGDEYGNAVSPKVGVSYVRDIGSAQVKLRAGYGEGTRPPPPDARVGTTTPQFGRIYIANSDIGPEEKTGWDAGIEVYWGNTASFGITRYDEDGENLIQAVAIDNTVSPSIYQYQNIGNVKSDGWELETKVNAGRFSLEANYAIADTEILELTDAAASGGLYQVGDRMWYAPKYSGGATLTARFWRGSAALNMSYVDDWVAQDLELLYDWIYGGDEWLGSSRAYLRGYPSIAKYNLRAEQAITDRITLFGRVDNLSNRQEADFSNYFTAPGRTAVIGARLVY